MVCCPTNYTNFKRDLSDFETCRDEFLEYRKSAVSFWRFSKAFFDGSIPQNKENCDKINEYNDKYTGNNFWDGIHKKCTNNNGSFIEEQYAPLLAGIVRKGDRPNMAAIGWTQPDKSIRYNCGGSIITEKFIVTAAHCKSIKGKIADTVRLGDRYLITEEDDETAQQLSIHQFIRHPDYKSSLHYHDIALIETLETITFNEFVVPSCIADPSEEGIGIEKEWTVAGYGETENGVPANVLLELFVERVPNEKCNEIFSEDVKLPRGIIDGQLCVKSKTDYHDSKSLYPDTCYGDSGSPLQYKTAYEVFPDDFNKTYLTRFYQSSNVIGIVSFGISCGFDTPSVYTNLAYYRDWIRSVITS